MDQQEIIEIVKAFHELYYANGSQTWSNTKWLGYDVLKCPLDAWIYQEIIFENKPDFIIETGTMHGGGTLFFASICDLINHGTIISIDTDNTNHFEKLPKHKRIRYITGSSIDDDTVRQVKDFISLDSTSSTSMAILDSDHRKEHVIQEMKIYGQIVSVENYLIVEDTNLDTYCKTGFAGPLMAVEQFLKEFKNFEIDKSKGKFYLSFNPNGYLKKISE